MNIKTIKGIFDSNTYVVELDGVCIIIEAGAPFEDVKQALADKSPLAIFLTHEHFDHIFYIEKYSASFPNCKVFCHPATLKELQTGEFNGTISRHTGYSVAKPQSYEKFHCLSDNQILNLGPFKIETIFAPGHSHGCVVYKINNNLFTGDVLFRTSIGRTDLITNGPELMQKSLRILQKITFETCYNGHSGSSTYKDQQRNIVKHIE